MSTPFYLPKLLSDFTHSFALKNPLLRLVPNALKKRVVSAVQEHLEQTRNQGAAPKPAPTLPPELLTSSTILADRVELLQRLPKGGQVAELGVDQGRFSAQILEHTQPQQLTLVDRWNTERYNEQKKLAVHEKFSEEIQNERVQIQLGNSIEVADKFPNQHFDWIYIDTDHSYETTRQELLAWNPKIKDHGIIAGHDFIVGNWSGNIRYGVIEAVFEFCIAHHWELLYLTADYAAHPSFAIRKV